MSKLQYMNLENLTLYDSEIKKKIDEAVKNDPSLRTVSQSEDGYTIYFYTKPTPVTIDDAVFSITFPKDAILQNILEAKSEVISYVGNIPNGSSATTVIDYLTELVNNADFDDSALSAKIDQNKQAIDVLNGSDTGSVKKQVADAIAAVVADAPESLDTLKEIADWLLEHESDAAGMNSQINTNKTDISALKALVGQLPNTTAAITIVDYIAEYVDKAISTVDLSNYALKSDLTAALGRITAVENTTEANKSAITELQGIVGDGIEAIPSDSIHALFSN